MNNLKMNYDSATKLIASMLDIIVKENLDETLKNIELSAPKLVNEGIAQVIMLHELNRLFYRATQLTIIFLEHAGDGLEDDDSLSDEYINHNVQYSLKVYNDVWDAMLKKTPFKSVSYNQDNLIGIFEAYNDQESLINLVENMPKDDKNLFSYLVELK